MYMLQFYMGDSLPHAVLHEGRLVEDTSQATHVVLRHRQQSVFHDLSTKGPGDGPKIVSVIWLLACLQERSLIDPAEWGSKVKRMHGWGWLGDT